MLAVGFNPRTAFDPELASRQRPLTRGNVSIAQERIHLAALVRETNPIRQIGAQQHERSLRDGSLGRSLSVG